jgi:hypothetical protein
VSALVRAWDAAWFGPVLDVRVWLMKRALLLMVVLDAWVLMIERGGRYGAGGFNVAHFAWLDAVQPVPTAGFYVSLILTCGVVAALTALGALGRAVVVGLFGLYTYAWAMSQLDSYQHHVFISWVLLCMCGFPALRTRVVFAARQQICAWGYRLLAVITAILYFFTGVSKAEPEWLSGAVLKRINSSGGDLEPFREAFLAMGFDEPTFWTLSGHSVVAVQWIIAALWLSVLVWGEAGGRWVRLGRLVGVASAVAFHVGAEVFGLRIGWFSWYMLALTLIAFTPARWLSAAARHADRLVAWLVSGMATPAPRERLVWHALGLLGALSLAVVGHGLDLPMTSTASLLWAALVVVSIAWTARRGRLLRTWAVAAALTATSLGVTIDNGRVRYDFYRYVGGDATRRLELHHALEAYGRANTYAPEGEGRWKKVAKVKKRLRGGE